MAAAVEAITIADAMARVQFAQAEPGAPLPGAVVPGEGGVVAEQEIEEEGVFPPFDSTTFASQLLWLAITFTTLYLLMSRVIIPRIGGILEDRRSRIAGDLEIAERLRQQSNEAIAGYEKALAESRADAFRIAEASRQQAKAAADARQQSVEADLDARLKIADARIAEIKRSALADVGEIASEAATDIVGRLLGRAPGRAAVTSAVTSASAGRVPATGVTG